MTTIKADKLVEITAAMAGSGTVREADPTHDAIDDVVPRLVVEPETPEAVATALRWASERKLSVVIRGAGTKIGWGRRPTAIDVIVDTRRLNRVLAHQHGDLTATIEAGASLRDVNQVLAQHGQHLPLDPPFEEHATIGGIIATNDSGPLRHRYGAPRDLIIGIRVATADGTLAKAGGQVVKNVAGYDLSKLMSGSFGSLAAIVGATFKLTPRPQASKTMVVVASDVAALGQLVRDVMASQLEPVAFEVYGSGNPNGSPYMSLLRFASLPAAVDAQVEQARERLTSCATDIQVIDGEAERELWREHANRLWTAPGAMVRASWLPADITAGLAELHRIAAGATVELIGRAGIGAGLIRIEAETHTQAEVIAQLRQSAVFGNIVVVRAGALLKALVDVWGPIGAHQRLLDSLKRALDPNLVLGAGRGPL